MNELIPPFDFQQHVIDVWKYSPFGQDGWGWRALMGFFVIAACGLVGNFLILRRMSLIGDAISHSALLGIVVVFMITHTLGGPAMMLGALVAGLVTVGLIELIHKTSRVKQDAAIGIAFTSLFALGVVLIHTQISDAHLDADCVLYGDFMHVGRHFSNVQLPDAIANSLRSAGLTEESILSGNNLSLPPAEITQMALVAMFVAMLLCIFYKELLVSSFDPALALSLGINATALHIALMSILSIVVVSAFDAVGAILVIAMLILPGATGHLLSQRLPVILWITIAFALLSSVLGLHMAIWMDCNIAAAMVVTGAFLFIIAWILSPHDGPIANLRARRASLEKSPEAMEAEISG